MNEDSANTPRRVVVVRDRNHVRAPLARDEVVVWVLPLDAPAEAVADMLSNLTGEERARAERYRPATAIRQFVSTRALLRRILGAQLGVPPLEVPISNTGAGKPVLAGAGIHFNVTHTDGLALIALAHRAVGIDVERVRDIANPEGLVSRFFSPRERDEFLALPTALWPAGFFRGWTCKEALIKASGLSVAYLDGFDIELHPERPAALLAARHPVVAAASWTLAAWEAEPGYAAAVAVEGAGELRVGAMPDQ
jgi:4'-phosphopantetheinyl transferase